MPKGKKKDQALDLLWRAQANDAYWHGLFGGIYLFNFRVSNYANLIEAEELAEGPNAPITVSQFDFDKDSLPEIVLTGAPFNALFKPNLGGMMTELDHRPNRYNLLNIMMRREEGYHDEIRRAAERGLLVTPDMERDGPRLENRDSVRAKEAGIQNYLLYDWHRRGSFIDHFLREDVDLGSFVRAFYGEQGDFVNLPYNAEVIATEDDATIQLTREGHVWVGSDHRPVRVSKTLKFRRGDDSYRCDYRVTNLADAPVTLRFGVELVSGFDGGQNPEYCGLTINGSAEAKSLAVAAEYPAVTEHTTTTTLRTMALTTRLDHPCTLWAFPLETITNSEAGYERGYQGTVYLHLWNLTLAAGASWQGGLTQQVSAYKK
ncbi:MAG: DUF1926 domain-containing protein, partial [Chloroflexi bacterium]|nr:DUF1926 domain-containing protein [Chloroflexota bacterium]